MPVIKISNNILQIPPVIKVGGKEKMLFLIFQFQVLQGQKAIQAQQVFVEIKVTVEKRESQVLKVSQAKMEKTEKPIYQFMGKTLAGQDM